MNYVEQDSFGMYAVSDSNGPGPRLMGADTTGNQQAVGIESAAPNRQPMSPS